MEADLAGDLLAVGCTTPAAGGRGEGVSLWRSGDGVLEQVGALPLPAPTFVAWHPRLPVLYAVEEVAQGAVTAVLVGSGGRLTAVGRVLVGGNSPCHLSVAPDGRHLLVACYGDGVVAAVALDADGGLTDAVSTVILSGSGPHPERQTGPRAHMALPRAASSGVLVDVVDLGGDAVHTLRLAADGALTPLATTRLPPGTGPRHLAVHGGTAHVVGELSATLTALQQRPDGGWEPTGAIGSAAGVPAAEDMPAHVQRSPDGRFLHVSHRQLDVVSVHEVPPGGLRPVADCPVAAGPRHFWLGSTRGWVAGQVADVLQAVTVDPRTGLLRVSGEARTGSPTCVAPAPRR